MKKYKPKKRVMLYWFIKYGFLFIFASFLCLAQFLLYNTYYYNLAKFLLMASIIIPYLGMIYLYFKWYSTNYFFLKNHIYLKDDSGSSNISYKDIKKIWQRNTLLESMLGITNIYIETIANKTYYLNGIKNKATAIELMNNLIK